MINGKKYPGLFITFEGPEGAGKSTQIKKLEQKLIASGVNCRLTREPGGTPLAENLREIIKHHQGETVYPESELLLLAAARSQHVSGVIRPALMRGEAVLCDRFADSTEAYQGGGRGMDCGIISALRKYVVGDCEPDLTLVLDLPVEEGFARTRGRAETMGNFDRFETQELDFHRRVREYFLLLAQREPQRVKVINALGTPDEISNAIWEEVNAVL